MKRLISDVKCKISWGRARCVDSSRVDHLSQQRGMPPCRDKGNWQCEMIESGILWEEPIPHYGLKGMG